MKKRKKNPYIVDYGYHLTNRDKISSILERGLIPKYKGHATSNFDINDIQKDLYRNIRPIYLLDIPNVKKLTKEMKAYIHDIAGYDTILKVDVRDYNQVPDYNSLILDYRFVYRKYRGENEPSLRIYKDYIKDSKFKKILSSYGKDEREFIIPLNELKNNEELQAELIYFTETFCVDEIISPDKIKEVLPL